MGQPDRINGVSMASAAYKSGKFDPAKDLVFDSAAFALPCQFCLELWRLLRQRSGISLGRMRTCHRSKISGSRKDGI
jgi:hypothetical protein